MMLCNGAEFENTAEEVTIDQRPVTGGNASDAAMLRFSASIEV
jgi:hypothetical protein